MAKAQYSLVSSDIAAGTNVLKKRTEEGYVYSSRFYRDAKEDGPAASMARSATTPRSDHSEKHKREVQRSTLKDLYIDPIEEFDYHEIPVSSEEQDSLRRALREKVLGNRQRLEKLHYTNPVERGKEEEEEDSAPQSMHRLDTIFNSNTYFAELGQRELLRFAQQTEKDSFVHLRQLQWFDLLRNHEYLRTVSAILLPLVHRNRSRKDPGARTRHSLTELVAICRETGLFFRDEDNSLKELTGKNDVIFFGLTFRFTDQTQAQLPVSVEKTKGKKDLPRRPKEIKVDESTATSWIEDRLRVRLVVRKEAPGFFSLYSFFVTL